MHGIATPVALTEPRGHWFGRLALVAKAAITAIVLYTLFRMTDAQSVRQAIAAMSVAPVLAAAGCFLLIPVLGGARWWMVLRAIGQKCGPGASIAMFSVASTVGQVLPSMASDGMRVWLGVRRGFGLRTATHSVVLERGVMLMVLLGLVAATEGHLRARVGDTGTSWIAPLLLSGAITGFGGLMVADRVFDLLPRWRLLRPLAGLSRDTRRLLCSPWGPGLVVLSALSNLNFVLAAALLGTALGLPVSFADYATFFPLVMVATLLPVSFGGWGVREGMMVGLLATAGAPAAGALALSLVFGVFAALCGLPGLLAWWRPQGGASWRDLPEVVACRHR